MNAALDQCPEGMAVDSAAAPFATALAVSAAMGTALRGHDWKRFMILVDERDDALRQALVRSPDTVSDSDRHALRELERQNRHYLSEAWTARATLAAEIKRIQIARAAISRYRNNGAELGVAARRPAQADA